MNTSDKTNRSGRLSQPVKLALVSTLCGSMAAGQDQPNILWITMEDTSPHFVGCYGDKNARTPNIDRLAGAGIRFTNAFATGTVCSPSRSAIITGVHTFKMGTGNHRSNYRIPEFIKGFPYYLKQQGYYVSNNVKTDYNVADMQAFVDETWHECSDTAGWEKRQPGQPFFSVFNFVESHQSRTMTNAYDWYLEHVLNKIPEDRRIAEDAFDIPPFYRDTPAMRKYFARVYNSVQLADIRIGELLDKLAKDNLRDSTIIFFYADHGEGIPRAKSNGINLGYRVPFVVWIPENYQHLSPWGTGGVVTDELISFTDLAPTVLSLAGADVPEHMVGRALMGPARTEPADMLALSSDRVDNAPDLVRSLTDGRFIYSRNFQPYMPQMRSIHYFEIGDITKEMNRDYLSGNLNPLQQSVFEARPAEYLFDTENDAWETTNLAEDPEYRTMLVGMRKQMGEQIVATRDVHFMTEYEIRLISETSNAYEYRMDDEQYPIQAVYAAASLSGQRGAAVTRQQAELLSDENRFVRYWAAMGLCSQPAELVASCESEITAAMDDAYPPVAVLASSLACQHFASAVAEAKMKAFCKHENNEISLSAINQLLYHENKEPFTETVQEMYQMKDRSDAVRAGAQVFLGKLNDSPPLFTW